MSSDDTSRRLSLLDWISFAMLAAGGIALATGLLPTSTAHATFNRVLPLLIFLGAVVVLAELASTAQLFDMIAVRITIIGRGHNVALFALCFAFATVTTVFLNLDTTAVLLTPVMIAAAQTSGIAALPLAMTTLWLANTASLLLPVSNLTNLLAANRIDLTPIGFAAQMALPQAATLVVVAATLWIFYWRHNNTRYTPPEPLRPGNLATFTAAAVISLAFVAAILAGISITIAAAVCAAGILTAFTIWDRRALSWQLLPWRLLVLVTGLFLVVDTLTRLGLGDLLGTLIGIDPGPAGMIRAAATGATGANLLNNLPVYLAGESVIPTGNHDQLIALLIGTNVGAIITPWAALATLLWAQRCRAANLTLPWPRIIATGAVTAFTALAASVTVLMFT